MPLVTVRHFYNHPEAFLAKSALDVDGIPAYLADHHIVGINWLFARAVGGIRLIVANEHLSRASEILEGDDSNILAGIPEYQLPPSQHEYCSSCGSTAVIAPGWGRSAKALSLWLPLFVLLALLAVVCEQYRCRNCGQRWR